MLAAYDMISRVVGGFNLLARLLFLAWIFLSGLDLAGRLVWRLLTRRSR